MKTINILNSESTELGSPLIKVVDLSSFSDIKWAELKVQLHANNPNLGMLDEWKLVKILVNDKVFYPSDGRNSTNKIHDKNDSDYFQGTLTTGKNRISIHWIAPVGAGFISPHSKVSAQLKIIGTELIPLPEEFNTIGAENIKNTIEDLAKKATVPSLIALILIIIVLVVMAVIVDRGAKITSGVEKIV